jgi:hypothetical protein
MLTLHVLELPKAFLALLFQHVASGPGGLASAAALGQTCKFLHSLSEGPAVAYSNLLLATEISSPDHPFWQWLVKKSGRIAGLSLELRLAVLGDDGDEDDHDDDDDEPTENADQLPDWTQPLQSLSAIPGVQLRVTWGGKIADLDHPCISLWLS